MLDITKPVRIKGTHHPVRIVCTDRKGSYPLLALVNDTPGNEVVVAYTLEGTLPNCLDWALENVPPVQDWRAIYRSVSGDLKVTGATYPTEQLVLQIHSYDASFVCAVKVTKD